MITSRRAFHFSLRGGSSPLSPQTSSPCPIVRPVMCELSYAPGADNDAAVDELARRLQAARGPGARIN